MWPQEGDLIRCPSCGALDSGNYCSQCGKSLYEEGTGWYHELFHELMPISKVFDVLRTFQNMLAHHKIFFSEVKEKNWSNKIKPIPFLITCIALMLLGATFFGSSLRSITWFDMLSYSGDDISEKEIDLFFEVLNVNLTEDDVSDEAFFSGSSTTSKGISAQTGSIEAHKVIAFIGNKGAVESNENYEKLADRFDKIIEDLQKTKSYVEPITSMLMPAALVIALWFVGSNIIKTSMVDRQMSFNILCYILAIVWVATEMVDIIMWSIMQDERITSRVSRIVIIPVWIYTYKVLKYTNVLLKNFFPIPASAQNGKVGGDVFLLSHIAVEERCKAVQWTKRSIEQAVAGRAKAVVLHCGRIEMNAERKRLYAFFRNGQINIHDARGLNDHLPPAAAKSISKKSEPGLEKTR